MVRTVSQRVSADPDRIAEFAKRIGKSKTPVLIYGAEIDRSQGWEEAVRLAELLMAPVYTAPLRTRSVPGESCTVSRGASTSNRSLEQNTFRT